jgi:hypothetical protein
MRCRRAALAAAVALTCACTAGAGHATTLPTITLHVKVALTATRVLLSRASAPRGYIVEFRVRNGTTQRRAFSVGGKTISVPAHATRITAAEFQARGKYVVVSRTSRSTVRRTFRVI